MDCYWEETNWFHLYANPPGVHGRLIATVESEHAAKQYLLDLAGVPIESWRARQYSEQGNGIAIWSSHYTSEALMEYEVGGTYYTAERVRVVKSSPSRRI